MTQSLPDALVVPQRTDLVNQVVGDFNTRAPAVSTDATTAPFIDANVIADTVLPIFVEDVRQAEVMFLDGQDSTELDETCTDMGIPTKLPAAGASGYAVVTTAKGGANIAAGQEIRNLLTGLRYQCAQSGIYDSTANPPNDLVPVTGIDTGPQTNLVAGTILTWTSPSPGLQPQATVFQNSDGSGLTGGVDVESDDDQRTRIRTERANPAVSGNDAAYQLAAMQTPGVGLGVAFTYAACLGAGTTCLAALLRPSTPGASRIPNGAQIGLVRGNVIGQMPKDDSSSFAVVLGESVSIKLGLIWAQGAASWADGAAAWPPAAAQSHDYVVTTSMSPTAFVVATKDPSPVTPQAGFTIAFFVLSNFVTNPGSEWLQKRLLSVTSAAPPAGYTAAWSIVIDTSNNASDTTYTPQVGDYVSPWSTSLGLLTPSIVTYFDGLGTGEQFATFFDAGYRQRRNPSAPKSWDYSVSDKMLSFGSNAILNLSAVEDCVIASPTTPFAPTIGTPGVSVYLLTLSTIAVYPKS